MVALRLRNRDFHVPLPGVHAGPHFTRTGANLQNRRHHANYRMTGFFMGKWASIFYSEMDRVSPICCRAIVIGGGPRIGLTRRAGSV